MVNLGYVVNVIEDPSERAEALRLAWKLTRQVLVVAAWQPITTSRLMLRFSIAGWSV